MSDNPPLPEGFVYEDGPAPGPGAAAPPLPPGFVEEVGSSPAPSYETALAPEEEEPFAAWKARYAANDSGDDYDLRGAFKAGVVPDEKNGHFPDTFKKPNHPTFSSQSQYSGRDGNVGGTWEDDGSFTPSATNLAYHSPQELQGYFAKTEPGAKLNLPREPFWQRVESGAKAAWDDLSDKASHPGDLVDNLNQIGIGVQQGMYSIGEAGWGAIASLPIKGLSDYARDLADLSKSEQERLEADSQEIGGGRLTKDIVSMGVSSLPALGVGGGAGIAARAAGLGLKTAGAVGLATTAVASGVQTYGQSFADDVARRMEAGQGFDQSKTDSFIPALAKGAGTAVVTALGGKFGFDAPLRLLLKEKGKETAKESIRDFLKAVGKDALIEAPEEAVDQGWQGAVDLMEGNPNMTVEEAVSQAVTAGLMAPVLGGTMGAATHLAEHGVPRLRPDPEAEAAEKIASNVAAAGAPATAAAFRAKLTRRTAADQAQAAALAEFGDAVEPPPTPAAESAAAAPQVFGAARRRDDVTEKAGEEIEAPDEEEAAPPGPEADPFAPEPEGVAPAGASRVPTAPEAVPGEVLAETSYQPSPIRNAEAIDRGARVALPADFDAKVGDNTGRFFERGDYAFDPETRRPYLTRQRISEIPSYGRIDEFGFRTGPEGRVEARALARATPEQVDQARRDGFETASSVMIDGPNQLTDLRAAMAAATSRNYLEEGWRKVGLNPAGDEPSFRRARDFAFSQNDPAYTAERGGRPLAPAPDENAAVGQFHEGAVRQRVVQRMESRGYLTRGVVNQGDVDLMVDAIRNDYLRQLRTAYAMAQGKIALPERLREEWEEARVKLMLPRADAAARRDKGALYSWLKEKINVSSSANKILRDADRIASYRQAHGLTTPDLTPDADEHGEGNPDDEGAAERISDALRVPPPTEGIEAGEVRDAVNAFYNQLTSPAERAAFYTNLAEDRSRVLPGGIDGRAMAPLVDLGSETHTFKRREEAERFVGDMLRADPEAADRLYVHKSEEPVPELAPGRTRLYRIEGGEWTREPNGATEFIDVPTFPLEKGDYSGPDGTPSKFPYYFKNFIRETDPGTYTVQVMADPVFGRTRHQALALEGQGMTPDEFNALRATVSDGFNAFMREKFGEGKPADIIRNAHAQAHRPGTRPESEGTASPLPPGGERGDRDARGADPVGSRPGGDLPEQPQGDRQPAAREAADLDAATGNTGAFARAADLIEGRASLPSLSREAVTTWLREGGAPAEVAARAADYALDRLGAARLKGTRKRPNGKGNLASDDVATKRDRDASGPLFGAMSRDRTGGPVSAEEATHASALFLEATDAFGRGPGKPPLTFKTSEVIQVPAGVDVSQPGLIYFNPVELAASARGMDPGRARDYFRSVVLEEVAHDTTLQILSDEARGRDPSLSPVEARKKAVSDLAAMGAYLQTQERARAVSNLYGTDFTTTDDPLALAHLALEYVRQITQARLGGRTTEESGAVSARMATEARKGIAALHEEIYGHRPDASFLGRALGYVKRWLQTMRELRGKSPEAAYRRLIDQTASLVRATEKEAAPPRKRTPRVDNNEKINRHGLRPDPHFGAEDPVSRRAPQSRGGGTPPVRYARRIYQAARRVRTAAAASLAEGRAGRSGGAVDDRDVSDTLQNAYLVGAFRSSEQQLGLLAEGTPAQRELAAAVRDFRRYVPLVPQEKWEALTAKNRSERYSLLEKEADYMGRLGNLAQSEGGREMFYSTFGDFLRQEGLEGLIGGDPAHAIEAVRALAAEEGGGWEKFHDSSEMQAYRDGAGFVYKIAPLNVEGQLADFAFLDGRPTVVNGPLALVGEGDRMPIFERVYLQNLIPGLAKTAIAGITDSGRVIIKQADLGMDVPFAEEFHEWARHWGYEMTTNTQPELDAEQNPTLARVGGRNYLMLDLVGRNARVVDGKVIPFDVLVREVTDEELASNDDLAAAAERLYDADQEREREGQGLDLDTPDGPDVFGTARRRSMDSILASPLFGEAVWEQASKWFNLDYDPKKLSQSERDAYDTIRGLGTMEDAYSLFNDYGHRMQEDVRTAGQVILLKAFAEAEYESTRENDPAGAARAAALAKMMVDQIAERGTELGRAVNALKALQTPRTWVLDYTSEQARVQRVVLGQNKTVRDFVDAAQGAFRNALDAAIDHSGALLERVEKATGVARGRTLWQDYADQVAAEVARYLEPGVDGTPKPELEKVADLFQKTLEGKIRELSSRDLTEPPRPKGPVTRADTQLRQLIAENPRLAEVWEETKREIEARYHDHPEALQSFEHILDAALGSPWRQRTLERAFRQNVDLPGLLWTSPEARRMTANQFADYVTADTGLSPEQRVEVADKVRADLDRLYQRKFRDALEKPGPALRQAGRHADLGSLVWKTKEEKALAVRQFADYVGEISPIQGQGRAEVEARISRYLDEELQRRLEEALQNPNVVRREMGRQVDVADVIRQAPWQKELAADQLAQYFSDNLGLTPAQAQKLTGALRAEIAAQFEEASTAALDRMAQTAAKQADQETVRRIRSAHEKLIELANLGGLSREQIYNALAPSFELPAWDAATAKEIEKRAFALQRLPEGSGVRARAAQELTDFVRRQSPIAALQLALSVHTANVLMNLGTQAVNLGSSYFTRKLQDIGLLLTGPRRSAFMRAFWNDYLKDNFSGQAVDRANRLLAGDFTVNRHTDLEPSNDLELAVQLADEGKKIPVSLFGKPFMLPTALAGKKGFLRHLAYVGRVMSAADTWIKTPMEQRYMLAAAYDKARKEGLEPEGEAFERRVGELMGVMDPQGRNLVEAAERQADQEAGQFGYSDLDRRARVQELIEANRPPDMRQAASDLAAEATFTRAVPYGPIGAAVGGLQWITRQVPAGRFVLKFLRTAANLTNEYLNYMPVYSLKRLVAGSGNLLLSADAVKRHALPAPKDTDFDVQLGKVVIGHTVLGMVLAALAAADRDDDKDPAFDVHGRGPQDARLRDALAEGGWVSDSLQFGKRANGKPLYVKYETLGPLAGFLKAVGEYRDATRYRVTQDDATLLDKLVMTPFFVGTATLDFGLMSGMRKLLGAISPTSNSGSPGEAATKAVGDLASSTVGGILPYAPALRDIEALFFRDRIETKTMLARVVSGLPVVRELAGRPALDMFGQPVERTPTQAAPGVRRFLSTNLLGGEEVDPVLDLMVRNRYSIGPNDSSMIYDPASHGRRRMTDDEQYRLVQLAGPRIHVTLAQMTDRLSRMDRNQFTRTVGAVARQEQARALAEMERERSR